MKTILTTLAAAFCVFAAEAATNKLGSIRATQYVVTSEDDPTVPSWAKSENPPETMNTNAVDSLIAKYDETNMTARIDAKASMSDVNNAITANEKEETKEQIVRGEHVMDFWDIRVGFSWFTDSAERDLDGNYFDTDYYRASEIDDAFVKKTTADSTSVFATNLLAVARADSGSIATNVVSPVYETVSAWENYWTGENVRISVTNYYGNTSGEPPRLRIEELDRKVTNTVAGVDYVTNVYKVVWDEVTRQTNYYARYAADVATISNNTLIAAERQTYNQLADKAPRAWGTVTSSGEKAPPNTVWHTAPRTVFAGGTEYAHVAIGDGEVCFLVDKGADVYTDGDVGQFYFKDASGQNYFGFDVRSSYTIGCRTDGIRVTNTNLVWLTYDLTSAVTPEILYATNLTDNVWQTADVTWEENPPTGQMVAYLNNQGRRTGFYKAQINYAGGSKFITNMQADLSGGIAATNETLNVIQSVEPYIQNGQVLWRVKQ